MMLLLCIEDKNTCQPKKAYRFHGKVFIYQTGNKIVVSENEKVLYFYLEEDETYTIYNYESEESK